MLKINTETYDITNIIINKYKLTGNKQIVDNTYKIQLMVSDAISVTYYNIVPLETFNKLELNKKYLINDYIDQNGFEIVYKGVYAEEFIFDNEIYLTKIGDKKFKLNVVMDTFTFEYHNIKHLELNEIIDFNDI